MRWLAPIASVAAIDRVVAELAPQLSLERCDWQPLHARAWRRVLKSHVLVWTAAMAPASIWFGWWVLPLWAGLMVWSWIAARGWARFAAWSLRDGVFAYRSGFVSRELIVVNIHKGQGVGLSSSPFDRRANMENVELDTAGASATGSRLQVPYLDEAVAKDLMKRLREAIDQGPDPLRLTVAETLPDTSAQ